ncbi:acyl-CoA thioesterase [Tumebacillus permanentifrigoris]|nr:acyl-CoA thioesterase [Tumebacillus permanentifrigoris]
MTMNLPLGFHHSLLVRFHEVDSMQVVHHSQYLVWLESTRWAFARDVLGIGPTDFDKLGFHLPVVRAQLDYVDSANLESEIVVVMHYLLQDKTLVSFKYRAYDQKTGKLVLRARTDHALVSNTTKKLLVQWPNRWQEVLGQALEEHPEYFMQDGAK